jgi:hypothetical protein
MNRIIKVLFVLLGICSLFDATAQQRIVVRGKVTTTGDPTGLPGVTVVELDKNNRITIGTVTNLDGEYALEVLSDQDRLQFTLLGLRNM